MQQEEPLDFSCPYMHKYNKLSQYHHRNYFQARSSNLFKFFVLPFFKFGLEFKYIFIFKKEKKN